MSRYNSNKAPYAPNQGLSQVAADLFAAKLIARKGMTDTPLKYEGVQYLGWRTMPKDVRDKFLRGLGVALLVEGGKVGRVQH